MSCTASEEGDSIREQIAHPQGRIQEVAGCDLFASVSRQGLINYIGPKSCETSIQHCTLCQCQNPLSTNEPHTLLSIFAGNWWVFLMILPLWCWWITINTYELEHLSEEWGQSHITGVCTRFDQPKLGRWSVDINWIPTCSSWFKLGAFEEWNWEQTPGIRKSDRNRTTWPGSVGYFKPVSCPPTNPFQKSILWMTFELLRPTWKCCRPWRSVIWMSCCKKWMQIKLFIMCLLLIQVHMDESLSGDQERCYSFCDEQWCDIPFPLGISLQAE